MVEAVSPGLAKGDTIVRRRFVLCLVALVGAIGIAGCGQAEPSPLPTAPPDSRIDQILEKLDELEAQVAILSMPTTAPAVVEKPAPTQMPGTVVPAPTHVMMEEAKVQDVAIVENYAATRFFPRNIVVLKDIPVRLYLTRLHREHVNKFAIEPFYRSSEVILPGEIGVIEFTPDQVGEFKIHNVGHNFDAALVVVETEEERKRYIEERGKQMYALIHSVDDFRIFPERLLLQSGIPATIFNISLVAEHKVSIKPFYDPRDLNVRPKKITPIEFTPDRTGEFTIRHEIHGFTGDLIVDENK